MKKILLVLPLVILAVAVGSYRAPQRTRKEEPRVAKARRAPIPERGAPASAPKPREEKPAPPIRPEDEERPEEISPDFIGHLDLKEGAGVIRGRLLRSNGSEAKLAIVTLTGEEDGGSISLFTDDRGAFEFLGVSAGPFQILCEYFPGDDVLVTKTASVAVAEGEVRQVELLLDPEQGTAVLAGRVESGTVPVPGCRVEVLSSSSSFRAEGRTRADGSYEITSLPGGPALVRILREEESVQTVLGEREMTLVGRQEYDLRVDEGRIAALEIRLRTKTGEPLPEERVCAQIVLRSEEGTSSSPAAWGCTDRDGRIRFPMLKCGDYLLTGAGGRESLTLKENTTVEIRGTAREEETD